MTKVFDLEDCRGAVGGKVCSGKSHFCFVSVKFETSS